MTGNGDAGQAPPAAEKPGNGPVPVREERIRVFISSSMDELKTERNAIDAWLRDAGFDTFLYDRHADAQDRTPREVFTAELTDSEIYFGVFWKRYGEFTIEEFDTAEELGVPRLVWVKEEHAPRDSRLEDWLFAGGVDGKALGFFESIGDEGLADRLANMIRGTARRALRTVRANNRALTETNVGGAARHTAPPGVPPRLETKPEPSIGRPPADNPPLDREKLTDVWFPDQLARKPRPPRVIGWYGPPHIGKEAMVRKLAHRHLNGQFSDGVVTVSARRKCPDDLVEWVADHFFDTTGLKNTDGRTVFNPAFATELAELQALIYVYDVEWPGKCADEWPGDAGITHLTEVFKGSTLVVTAADRGPYPGDDVSLYGLGPLPPPEAVELLARKMGKPLDGFTAEEYDAAAVIVGAAGFLPGRIINLAACAQRHGLVALASDDNLLDHPCLTEFDFSSVEQEQVFNALLAFAGEESPQVVLNKLFVDVERIVKGMAVAESCSPRFALVGELPTRLQSTREADEWVGPVLAATLAWAEEEDDDSKILAEQAFILRAMERGAEKGFWPGVLKLARAVEAAFFRAAQWGTWERVLHWAHDAAVATKDRSAEAWALHQLGTRQLGLGDDRAACPLLEEARDIRIELGEQTGAAVSQMNLKLVRDALAASTLSAAVMLLVAVVALAVALVPSLPWAGLDFDLDARQVPVGSSRPLQTEAYVNGRADDIVLDFAMSEQAPDDAADRDAGFCVVTTGGCRTAAGAVFEDVPIGALSFAPLGAVPGVPLAQPALPACPVDLDAATMTVPAATAGCTLQAFFVPPEVGEYRATVTLRLDRRQWEVRMIGAGIDPDVTLTKAVVDPPPGAGPVQPGTRLAYEIVATNRSEAAITRVAVSDAALADLVCGPPPGASLEPGEAMTCRGAYVVTGADGLAGEVVNRATVRYVDGGGDEQRGAVTTRVPTVIGPGPLLLVSKSLTGAPEAVAEGERLEYVVTVTNAGGATAPDVVVTDVVALSCDPAAGADLAPGDTMTCTGVHVVTAADVAAGIVRNEATVGGVDAPAVVVTPVAGLAVTERLTTNADEDRSGTVSAGDTLTFSVVAVNTGGANLVDVAVADTLGGLAGCARPELAAGAELACAANHVVTASDAVAGQVCDVATARGEDLDGDRLVAEDEECVAVPPVGPAGLALVKSHAPDRPVRAGEDIVFSYAVRNTGDRPLTDVRLADPLPRLRNLVCAPAQGATLDPGDRMSCTADHVADGDDLAAGGIRNVATVTGLDPGGVRVSATAVDEVEVLAATGLSLDKTLVDADDSAGRLVLTYGFVATNTGDPLRDLAVTDSAIPGLDCNIAALARGATHRCEGQYTVTAADEASGEVVNTATARATGPAGEAVTAADTLAVRLPAQPAALGLAMTGPIGPVAVGDPVTYRFVVANEGLARVTRLTLTDPASGEPWCGLAPDALAPAPFPTASCQATVVVSAADAAAGQVCNEAAVTGRTSRGTPVSATDEHCVPVPGSISLVSAGSPRPADPGDTIAYLHRAANTGGSVLRQVRISVDGSPLCSRAELAPGASLDCPDSQLVTDADAGTTVVTVATVTATDPGGATVSASDIVAVPVRATFDQTLTIVVATHPVQDVPELTTDPALFTFTVDGGPVGATGPGALPALDVAAGLHTITGTRAAATHWRLASVTCSPGALGATDLTAGTVTVDVVPGAAVQCVFGYGLAVLDADPEVLELNGSLASRDVTLTNVGTAPLRLSGFDATGFTFSGCSGSTLAPDDSCAVTITPSAGGFGMELVGIGIDAGGEVGGDDAIIVIE